MSESVYSNEYNSYDESELLNTSVLSTQLEMLRIAQIAKFTKELTTARQLRETGR
jgi:hypothetical protein